ncbi:hypothetical protein HGRIS_014743 [Hohenbuehelia grisea]|uniref:Uncharacterized protein n=1 Tax=Hohenbuehelia grisea TaxID=104357 RepID=A0ABR3IQR2_9AGAR
MRSPPKFSALGCRVTSTRTALLFLSLPSLVSASLFCPNNANGTRNTNCNSTPRIIGIVIAIIFVLSILGCLMRMRRRGLASGSHRLFIRNSHTANPTFNQSDFTRTNEEWMRNNQAKLQQQQGQSTYQPQPAYYPNHSYNSAPPQNQYQPPYNPSSPTTPSAVHPSHQEQYYSLPSGPPPPQQHYPPPQSPPQQPYMSPQQSYSTPPLPQLPVRPPQPSHEPSRESQYAPSSPSQVPMPMPMPTPASYPNTGPNTNQETSSPFASPYVPSATNPFRQHLTGSSQISDVALPAPAHTHEGQGAAFPQAVSPQQTAATTDGGKLGFSSAGPPTTQGPAQGSASASAGQRAGSPDLRHEDPPPMYTEVQRS